MDALVKDAHANGGSLGVQELLNHMTKAVLERALETEMTHHLGHTALAGLPPISRVPNLPGQYT
ncbi:hypothetical protein FKR81_12755 [Lentzea tibetensis]|uniref:Transposase, Mutator family n=1 Tax=Lentzea tibetensis TaxID=2591470 RepID=A0A563EWR1_9PSEU|nr:hypothetical protein FKR81_12755 [Lentzea tibetensis]